MFINFLSVCAHQFVSTLLNLWWLDGFYAPVCWGSTKIGNGYYFSDSKAHLWCLDTAWIWQGQHWYSREKGSTHKNQVSETDKLPTLKCPCNIGKGLFGFGSTPIIWIKNTHPFSYWIPIKSLPFSFRLWCRWITHRLYDFKFYSHFGQKLSLVENWPHNQPKTFASSKCSSVHM